MKTFISKGKGFTNSRMWTACVGKSPMHHTQINNPQYHYRGGAVAGWLKVLFKFLTCPYILVSFWRLVMHALFSPVQVE